MNVTDSLVNRFLLVFWVCAITLVLAACENPGTVGGSFTDIGSEVVIDTLEIGPVEIDSIESYSGRLSYFSSGRFNDPLFGNLTVTGLLRPSLPSASSANEIEDGATIWLNLAIDQNGVYGDTQASAQFDLVEIDQVWRGKSWQLHDEVQLAESDPVASFEVSPSDTLKRVPIDIDHEWTREYIRFYESSEADRDSSYTYNFHGLAVVSTEASPKIVPFDASESEFIIISPDEEDTTSIGLNQWAYSLQRTEELPAPEGSVTVHSTLEKVLVFDMDLTEQAFGTVNIAKVDLVFYRNNQVLNETIQQAPASASRPPAPTARLHFIYPENASTTLDPGSPIVAGRYDEDDEAYHFNITAYVNSVLINSQETDRRFYVRLHVNDGTVRSSLLYNHEAAPEKRPKLIVTSTKSEGSLN